MPGALVATEENRLIGLPAYQRIEEDIREQIRTGYWPLGSTLPSRRDLARRYGVQLPTLQRAVAALLADGTLSATARQGTMVARASSAAAEFDAPVSQPAPAAGSLVAIVAQVSFDPEARYDGSNFNGAVVNAAEAEVATVGCLSSFISRAKYDDATAIKRIAALGASGVIMVATLSLVDEVERLASRIESLAIPAVFVTAEPLCGPFSSVSYDQVGAGYRAGRHLIQAGARRLVYFSPYDDGWIRDRAEGIRRAVSRMRFPVENYCEYPVARAPITTSVDQIAAGYKHAAEWHRSGSLRGSSLVACNDKTALGVYQFAHEAGLVAGADYQLVGFDDTSDARDLGLTSMRPPAAQMGIEAARLLARRLSGDTAVLQVSLQSHVVARSSSRAQTGAADASAASDFGS